MEAGAQLLFRCGFVAHCVVIVRWLNSSLVLSPSCECAEKRHLAHLPGGQIQVSGGKF